MKENANWQQRSQLSVTKLTVVGYISRFFSCDNAGENVEGLYFGCGKFNIQIKMTAPYTTQQNGMVKQKFVKIYDQSCAAVMKAKLTEEYQGLLWAKSVLTSTRLTYIVCNTQRDKYYYL